MMSTLFLGALLFCSVISVRSLCESPCSCKLIDKKSTASCSNVNLKTIPRTLDPDSEELDLSHNSLARLPDNVFRDVDLLNLQTVDLHANKISEIGEDAFRGVTNLRKLDLSDNKLATMRPGTIPRWVLHLNLNGNPLRRLEPNNFLSSPLLRQLHLERCEIDSIHPNALIEATGLQVISLRNNQLKNLNETVFKEQRQLVTLRLEGNPWDCDCSLRRFRDWYYKYDEGTVTCQSPKSLNGTVWKGLTSFDFVCK
ncbi:hypothetical protein PPYR_03197 [Photinus pyralis]|uniref:LRRCT domain-containing protein n=2 Tax=Photinus pyralis TaxID=7054 RepID=A0A5N4A253_PHOPY|nr:hypothetical protein PPYR_03197 [Photinus pyralis]